MQQKRLVETDPKLKKDDLIVITGGGGFIAVNLAEYFRSKGFTRIRAVDKKPALRMVSACSRSGEPLLDCSQEENCHRVCEGAVESL